tara:strand:- start:55 stop:822 length:768 start_codon:yes stop_codon:yes gene_type:complete
MKYHSKFYLIIFFLTSCSTKSNLLYLNGSDNFSIKKLDYTVSNTNIETGDILHIDIQTINPDAAIPYNKYKPNQVSQNIDVLKIEGYVVDQFQKINFPVLGKISVQGLSTYQLEEKINKLLVEGGHLTNLNVKVRKLNSKFTVLGEVRSPGTFSFFDEKLNIFQALGYAGDLSINGKRKKVKLIREINGIRKIYKIDLTKSDILSKPYYQIRNNDVIIIQPNFSKVKSAGFIGSPTSIASISSMLVSITLLFLNR